MISSLHVEIVFDAAKVPVHEQQSWIPQQASASAAGFDLKAAITQSIIIAPQQRALIGCGFSMAFPAGFEAQVRPRSGLALHHGVSVLNAPGTIDADYRGEVAVVLINHGDADFKVERGMRIAQLVFAMLPNCVFTSLLEHKVHTERSTKGFGSTGLHS
jgi:dUTP pyrophosphatase